jgi:hypothetical protein
MIGRFYFQKTIAGNLLGEFSNSSSSIQHSKLIIQTESAELVELHYDFTGIYRSSWNEIDKSIKAEIIISYKLNTNNQIFSLVWLENGNKIFWGEGMRCGELLIGDYRDFETVK